MPKDIHIGKKIESVLKATRYKKTEFADMINISRTVVYDIFKRETIDTGLLKKISEVLNHDFFIYYQLKAIAKEPKGDVVKNELAEITQSISKLTKSIERIEEQLLSNTKKKNGKK